MQKSSLPYQLLLLSELWYFSALVLVDVLIFFYKGPAFRNFSFRIPFYVIDNLHVAVVLLFAVSLLPYPTRNLLSDALLLITLTAIELVRNSFGAFVSSG